MIKLISFDFWDTLFKGDPEHSKARVSYISDKYGLDPEFVKKTIKETKKWCDAKGVETLTGILPETQLYFLGRNLGIEFDVSDARNMFFQLLRKYPPICLLDQNVMDAIGNEDVYTCISCNTGFMGCKEVEWAIGNSIRSRFFDYIICSDRIGVFKPNPDWERYLYTGLTRPAPSEIIHVGDNDLTDGQLCRNTGMHFVKVEPKNPDFSPIFEIIEKEKNG